MKEEHTRTIDLSTIIGLRNWSLVLLLAAALFVGLPGVAGATTAASVGSDFYYNFNSSGTLNESGSMDESNSPYFYLNSGGQFLIEGGVGKTIQDELAESTQTYLLYALSNALDTDGGHQPQNLFRLLTRSKWEDASNKVSWRITDLNLSSSPNRDGHNGILLFSRYQDQDNLYYAGVRSDGSAIIKKKIGGTYYTLASVQGFGTKGKYDRDTTPSLLPLERWTGMKLETYNLKNGGVRLRLLLDRENDGSFVSILSADDTGLNGNAFTEAGYSGIRTDFMDVEFDNYRLT